MSNICDTTGLMVHGHVPWLEMPGSHAHAGRAAEVRLFWGREMQPDGLLRLDELTAYMVSPDGARRNISLLDEGQNYYSLFIPVPEDGLYHVVAKNLGSFIIDDDDNYVTGSNSEHPDSCQALCIIQYAQVFVPVGHQQFGKPQPAGIPLEIVPETWKQWNVGEEIFMRVQYNSKPLAALNIDLACAGGTGGCRQWREVTDEEGRFILRLTEACRYLITARYQLQQRDENFQNNMQFDTTLSLMVLKQEHQHAHTFRLTVIRQHAAKKIITATIPAAEISLYSKNVDSIMTKGGL